MKVFISWSGERSKEIANKLRDWTQSVIQAVEPWMSEEDIAKGAQWGVTLSSTLQDTHFGILCLTPENLTAPLAALRGGRALEVFRKYACVSLLVRPQADRLWGAVRAVPCYGGEEKGRPAKNGAKHK